MTIRLFELCDQPAVIELWQQCNLMRPQNNPEKDIQRKLKTQPGLFLIAVAGDQIVGTVMAGYEGHRGWINYLAVAPAFQRRGIGRALMGEAQRLLVEAGCPKINLQIRSANQEVIEFYRAIGFSVDDVISMGKRLEQD
jgi:ribosomal protein S18 acetylase RimI-like enzyme